jgi:hypothetical protein
VTIINFPKKQPDSPFFEDIVEEGYHVFSLKNAKVPDYYPAGSQITLVSLVVN